LIINVDSQFNKMLNSLPNFQKTLVDMLNANSIQFL